MHRLPKSNELLPNTSPWKGVSWTVSWHVNSRQIITECVVTAGRTNAEGVHECSTHIRPVEPFDSVIQLVREALVEAALGLPCFAEQGDQLDLFEPA